MNEHPQFVEDIDLLAFGLLEEESCAGLREHLENCAPCRARFEEAQGISTLLSLSTPAAAPPARVRARLLANLDGEHARVGEARAPAVTPLPPRAAPAPARFSIREYLGWAVAAAVLLLALSVVIPQNRRTQSELAALHAQVASKQDELDRTRAVLDLLRSTDAMRVHLVSSTAPWPWPEGKVYFQAKTGLLFVATHLPPLDAGKAYQLWVVPEDGNPASAGIFEPDELGNATLMLHRVPVPVRPRTFAVTIEPEGGAPGPTGPQVMVGEQ